MLCACESRVRVPWVCAWASVGANLLSFRDDVIVHQHADGAGQVIVL